MKPYKVSSEENVTSLLHVELYNAARVHYFNWIFAEQDKRPYDPISVSESAFKQIWNIDLRAKASRWGLIVFSAFTLEAFINFYAEINKMEGRRALEKKLSTRDKWSKYPKQIAEREVAEQVQICINSIFDLRNRLGHHKPITGHNPIMSPFTLANGRRLLNKVHYCVRSLDDLKAPSKSATWISEDFEDAADWAKDVML